MSVTDDLLKNNETYAAGFTGPLPLPPSKHVAVVACMDARTFRHFLERSVACGMPEEIV